MKRNLAVLVVGALLLIGATGRLTFDRSRARHLDSWKSQIADYSNRHYGEPTWKLEPTCIVLHYTVSEGFPWNLVNTHSFKGETPGLAVHYVVDGSKIWEVLPPKVRSRGAYGINHRGINIEMIAMEAQDLSRRQGTLNTTTQLCRYLMKDFQIPKSQIYSHQQVSTMDTRIVPEAFDLINPYPYHKIDPGPANMKTVLNQLKNRY